MTEVGPSRWRVSGPSSIGETTHQQERMCPYVGARSGVLDDPGAIRVREGPKGRKIHRLENIILKAAAR